jgi:hypothetical protein
MGVARALGRGDAGGQRGSGLSCAAGLGQELAKLEVSGDVFRMRAQEGFEVLVGRGGVSGIGAFHRQAVAGKGIGRLGGDELFENLAARFLLWLGRSHAHSIFALAPDTKCQVGQPLLAVLCMEAIRSSIRERELHNETIVYP